MTKFRPEKSFLDHVLATLGCMFAVFSLGMSVGKGVMAMTLLGAVAGFAFVGFAISHFANQKVREFGGWLFGFAGLGAVLFTRSLNGLLPEEGFPFELIAGSSLTFIILAGCLFAWSDGALLFLALPTIAIFGLVGTFDVYKFATVLFFIFMVCVAVLYARVHQRVMISRATKLGADPEQLRKGAWRWMAGPEWGLASAGIIIIFSLLGAPLLQLSLTGLTGRVSVSLPAARSAARSIVNTSSAEQPIGLGSVNLSESPVFTIQIDQPRYLRQSAYVSYLPSGWSTDMLTTKVGPDRLPKDIGDNTFRFGEQAQVDSEKFTDPLKIKITIHPLTFMRSTLPAPGPVVGIVGGTAGFEGLSSGAVITTAPLGPGYVVTYFALVPNDTVKKATSRIPDEYSRHVIGQSLKERTNISEAVFSLLPTVIGTARTPYDKATAITKWVGNRCKYNTKIGPVPKGRDPVDYFLNQSREGYCDLFASSVVLLSRSAGLTARYATGYLMNDQRDETTGLYTIREKDSHAWAEVYFQGSGWVPFDATEYATSVEGGERGKIAKQVGLWEKPWFRALTASAGALAGIYLVFVLLPRLFKGGANGMLEVRDPLIHRQNQFQSMIQAYTGHPRRFTDTLHEYVTEHAETLGEAMPLVAQMVSQFESQMFSPAKTDKTTLKGIDSNLKELGAKLKQQTAAQRVKR